MIRLLLALLFIGSTSTHALAQDTAVINIGNNNNFQGYSLLEKDLTRYNAFFTGENHLYHQTNVKLELKTFRYLHKNAGVNVFVMEFGAGAAWLVEQYVQTGDTTFLNATKYYPWDVYDDLFKGLRKYYKELPPSNKFHIVGLDREGSAFLAVEALTAMMPDTRPDDSLVSNIDALRMQQKRFRELRKKSPKIREITYRDRGTLRHFIANYDRNKEKYQTWLGNNFPAFERTIASTKLELEITKNEARRELQAKSAREEYMYQQLVHLYDTMPSAKIFGQFGRCHVSRADEAADCDFYGLYSLNKRINTSNLEQLKGKVLSIGILYEAHVFSNSDSRYWSISDSLDYFQKDKLTLTRLHPGDDTFGEMSKHFDYIIVNRQQEDTLTLFTDEFGNTMGSYEEGYFSISALYGFHNVNLNKLNDALFIDETAFGPELYYWGGEMTVLIDQGPFFAVGLKVFTKQKRAINDTSQVALKGFLIDERWGVDLTPMKWLNAVPSFGLGYGRLKYTPTYSTTIAYDLGTLEVERYINHVWYIDGRLDLSIDTKYVTIGAQAGYMFDFSNDKWKISTLQHLNNGAGTKMTGWYLGLKAGVNFGL